MALESVSTVETSIQQKDTAIMTGEELYTLGDFNSGELIKGEFIEMAPPGFWHGIQENRIGNILNNFVDQHKLGYVMVGEAGLYTSRNPDTVRGVDVAFISHERMAQVRSESYLDVAPELIVEVLSPHDRWDDIHDKLAEYFAIGVELVWVADPKRRQVHIYRALTEVEILTAEQTLSGGDALPGFSVPVAELFARP